MGLGWLATDVFALAEERFKAVLGLSSLLAISAILWPQFGGVTGAVLRCVPYGCCCLLMLWWQLQANLFPAFRVGVDRWTLLASLFATVAFGYLLGGVFWLVVAVSGSSFLGYSGLQALLTCNHFHFAGFGATAVSSKLLELNPKNRLVRFCSPAFGVGMMWVALGITLAGRDAAWRPLEMSAALFESAALACLGAAFLTWKKPQPFWGFKAAGLSAVVAALFSSSFALRGFAELTPTWLGIMMIGHGCLNALGVCLLGLGCLRRVG